MGTCCGSVHTHNLSTHSYTNLSSIRTQEGCLFYSWFIFLHTSPSNLPGDTRDTGLALFFRAWTLTWDVISGSLNWCADIFMSPGGFVSIPWCWLILGDKQQLAGPGCVVAVSLLLRPQQTHVQSSVLSQETGGCWWCVCVSLLFMIHVLAHLSSSSLLLLLLPARPLQACSSLHAAERSCVTSLEAGAVPCSEREREREREGGKKWGEDCEVSETHFCPFSFKPRASYEHICVAVHAQGGRRACAWLCACVCVCVSVYHACFASQLHWRRCSCAEDF